MDDRPQDLPTRSEDENCWSHGAGRPPLACYANYFEVGHNAFEFLLNAGQVEPQSGKVQLLTRIAVSPVHAKLLARLLCQSLDQFEDRYQSIPDIDPDAGEAAADLAFTNPAEFEQRAIHARRKPTHDRAGDTAANER